MFGLGLSGQIKRSGPVSRVLSWTTISLGRRLLVGSSNLPGRVTRRTASRCEPVARLADFALLGLASGGVYRAEPVTRSAGALLPHRFTLTTSLTSSSKLEEYQRLLAVYFLWHCPGSCERWVLPTTVSCEARTFLRRLELVNSWMLLPISSSLPRSPSPLRASTVRRLRDRGKPFVQEFALLIRVIRAISGPLLSSKNRNDHGLRG